MEDKQNIVVFLPRPWEMYVSWPNIIAMSKYANVLAIEPPVSLIDVILRPNRITGWIKESGRLRRISDSLIFYTPLAFSSYGISAILPLCKSINSLILARCLKRKLLELGIKDYVAFIFKAQQDFLLDILGDAKLICYEITDDYPADPRILNIMRKAILRSERIIAEKVDLIFAVSEVLCQRLSKLNPNTYYLRNAADVKHFVKALDKATRIPRELEAIPNPRIGLIGYITEIVDIALLKFVAKTHPGWSMVLIGPVVGKKQFLQSSDFQDLKYLPNVFLLGWKDYGILPAFLKGLDVCLLPYIRHRYTESLHPQKMYQYLAAGKPVVSTDFPNVRPLAEVIGIANNYEDFARAISKSLKEDCPELIDKRVKIAHGNSVDIWAQERINIIERYL